MGKLQKTLKKVAAALTATVLSFTAIIPAYAADTSASSTTVSVLSPGYNEVEGGSFADKITALAGSEANIKAIKWSDSSAPDGTQTKEMAVAESGGVKTTTSTKAWFDSATQTIYLHSDAAKVYVNPNASGMFYNFTTGTAFSNLEEIDLGPVDWSLVTTMESVFYKTSSLKTIDLSKFNGSLTSYKSQKRMFYLTGATTIILPDSWTFYGPIGLQGNWTKDGSGPYTSYKIEMSKFGGGTYVKVDSQVTGDGATIYQAAMGEPNNVWPIEDTNAKFTGFCINDDTYDENGVGTKAPGAGEIFGYYLKVETSNDKLVNGVSNGAMNPNNGYLNSDNYGYEPLGSNMREALITLLYYGPTIYDITTEDGYNNLQQDIWHFTNHYSETWVNESKWSGKTFESIPNHDSYKLYTYVSNIAVQNMITTESIVNPETPTYEVKILKKAVVGSSEKNLANAKLLVKGPKSYSVTTGTKAAALNLPVGTYTLSEAEAPDGYQIADPITFVVGDDGKVTVDGETVDTVVMKDELIKAAVKIKKVDENGKAVSGAKLTLSNVSTVTGVTVKDLSITTNGKTIGATVYPGTYTLTETETPKGYTTADPITFTIASDATITVNGKKIDAITMIDYSTETKRYEVEIEKADIAGKEIEGAVLTVTGKNADGDTITPISITTGKDTSSKIKLEAGSYTLTETTAPDGFEKAESIKFTVDSNGKVTVSDKDANGKITMTDEYSKKTVKISKQDIAGEEIDGAKLTVSGTTFNGSKIEDITWTSSKNGAHAIEVPAGDYTLTETTAPKGYEKSESIKFSVDQDGKVTVNNEEVKQVTMTDKYADVDVNISKQDNYGDLVKGATLKIEGKTVGGDTYTRSINTTGEILQLKLQPGKYTMTETQVPDGYEKAEAITFNIDTKGVITIDGKEVTQIVMVDRMVKKTVKISKQDINGNEIAGATLTVTGKTDDGEEISPISFQTDGKTVHEIEVYPGTYELTETIAPTGYQKATSIQFVVKKDGTVVSGKKTVDQITMVDKFSGKTVKISKQDINGNEIAGAKLTISHAEDDTTVTDYTWVSEDGVVREFHLNAGTYTLSEVSAPDGYVVASDIEFVVDTNGKVTVDEKQVDQVVMTDKMTTVKVAKVKASDTSSYLEGAQLQILDSGKNVVEAWTSTSKAHEITGVLAVGQKYTLHEVSAPSGYAVADDITFTVTSSTKTITMKDAALESETGKLTVKKVDSSNTSKFVSGAKLQLLDNNKKVVEEWTTDSAEHVVTAALKLNTKYTLHETSAPDGYAVASDITFTMTTKDKIVIMKDKATSATTTSTGTVTIKKVEDGKESTFVSGAKLQILDSNSKVIEEWTTDNSAHTVTATLTSGQKYTLHEVSAPSGYSVASDITFTASTKAQTLAMKDKSTSTTKTGTVTVKKVEDGSETTFVSGAKLQILDSNGSVVEEWTTDKKAHTVTATLTSGAKYTLHEESAPNGYETASDMTFTAGTSAQTLTMKDKKMGSVTVKKVDEDSKNLAGAQLQILDSNNKVIEYWTSDSSDHIVTAVLTKGSSYKLHEVAAPDGYEVAEDVTFTYNGSAQTVTMTDKATSAKTSTGKKNSSNSSASKSTTKRSAATGDASNLPMMAVGIGLGAIILGSFFSKKKRK